MGMETGGGRSRTSANFEEGQLEGAGRVQALVKRFYQFEGAKPVQKVDPSPLLDEAGALLGQLSGDASTLLGLLSFLLRHVVPKWVLPLSHEQRERYLDAYLLRQTGSPVPRWCVLVALSEALTWQRATWEDQGLPNAEQANQGAGGKAEQQLLPTVVERLRGFLEGPGLKEAMREVATDGQESGDASSMTPQESADRLIHCLFLLPLRLANTASGRSSLPDDYHDRLSETALEVCLASLAEGNDAGGRWLWSSFVVKAVRMGQAASLAKAWVASMAEGRNEGGRSQDHHNTLFGCLPVPALETMVVEIIRALSRQCRPADRQDLFNLLVVPSLRLPASPLAPLLRTKLLLSRVLSAAAARLLANASAEAGTAKLVTLTLAITQVWKGRHFLMSTDGAQQAYLTAALVACLRRMDKHTLETAEGGRVLSDVLEGVGSHLEASIPAIRIQGMRVAEAFAKAMGTDLHFDELDDRDRRADEDDEEGMQGEDEKQTDQEEGAGGEGAAGECERSSAAEGEGPEDEEEEEEDLEPYDLSDSEGEEEEEELRKVAKPRYLRRLVELLRARDEDDAYARLTTALKEAPALIRSKPIDLPDLSACLTRDLLTLENRFAAEDFAAQRDSALVSLMASDPQRVGPLMAAYAFDHIIGFGARLEVMALLERGARDLAGPGSMEDLPLLGTAGQQQQTGAEGVVAGTLPRVRGKRSLVPSPASQAASADGAALSQAADNSNDGRTRRWGRRREVRTFRNAFAPHALRCFFRPLLHGLVNHIAAVQAKEEKEDLFHITATPTQTRLRDHDEAMLLAKAIECLCVFIECSGPHGPSTAQMAEELLTFAWPFRGSTFPEVRKSVLLSVACGAMTLGSDRLLVPTQGGMVMDAMAEWVVVTKEKDPDADCRRIAGLLVAAS